MTERVTGHTELIGLIAYPIRHSMSPTMHNEAFKKLGLDYVYVAFEVDNSTLEDTVKGIRAMKIRGCNVSMPNKRKITQYLDKLSDASALTGSVNTVVNDNGVLTGHITDGIGCMHALSDEGIDIKGKKITIMGTGGAGTAIIVQAGLDGAAELSVFNRADEFVPEAKETVAKVNDKTSCKAAFYKLEDQDKLRAEIASSDILINATGVGMKPMLGESLVTDPTMLRPDLVVFDCVYSPTETRLLEIAKEVGCKAINGLGMMLFQGAAAFKLFTNEEMPIDYMKDVLF
ncbi:MAG: shikimate dehydrogenase [Eubacteriaceae bacterium]|nr:shikimate dehydrogenase [Eubacteriaceae bacterium]